MSDYPTFKKYSLLNVPLTMSDGTVLRPKTSLPRLRVWLGETADGEFEARMTEGETSEEVEWPGPELYISKQEHEEIVRDLTTGLRQAVDQLNRDLRHTPLDGRVALLEKLEALLDKYI